MTLIVKRGDLLAQQGILVHGCNSKGVMGSGIAESVKERFPAAYRAYRRRFEAFGLTLGEISMAANPALKAKAPLVAHKVDVLDDRIPEGVIVVNAVTQERYGRQRDIVYVSYPAVSAAFSRVRELVAGLRSAGVDMPVNYPLIGCGLANGDWSTVSGIIEQQLDGYEHALWVRPQDKWPL